MGEPARQFYNKDDETGEEFHDSLENKRANLKALEGGGEGDGVPRGSLKSVDDKSKADKLADEQMKRRASDDGGLYQNGMDENRKMRKAAADEKASLPQTKKGRFASMSKTKKRIYTGAGGSIIGLAVFLLPILSGPLQFLSLADVVLKNFRALDAVSDIGNSNLLRRLRYINQPERARLGVIGNRVADNIQNRLAADGIGINLDAAGYPESFSTPDGDIIRIADLDNPRNAGQRRAFRRVLRSAGYGRVATALMSRPLNYRMGIDFKPLGNIKRRAAQSFAEFRQARVENENERIREGSFAPGSIDQLTAEQQRQMEALQQELDALDPAADNYDTERQRILGEMDTLRGSGTPVGDFADVQDSYQDTIDAGGTQSQAKAAARKTLLSRVGAAGGIITGAVMLGVCFTQNIGEAALLSEFRDVFAVDWRHAMNSASIASQIMNGGEEVDFDELAVLSERFVDEASDIDGATVAAAASIFGQTENQTLEKDTSWDGADTINYQLNGETSGYAAASNLVPGTVQEDNIVKASQFFSFSAGFCDFMANPIVEGVTIVLEFGLSLFGGAGAVLRAVGGLAIEKAFELFLLSPFGESMLARIVGEPVAAMIAGQGFGHANGIGGIIGSSEAGRDFGAFTLNTEDSRELRLYIAELEREDREEENFIAKMFSFNDPDSLVGSALLNGEGNGGSSLLASILNPGSMLSGATETIASLASGSAYAQSTDLPLAYQVMDPIAYSVNEIESELVQDPFANEDYLIDKYGDEATLESTFGGCFDPLPTLGEDDIEADYFRADIQCAQAADETFYNDLLRYRFYQLHIRQLTSLGCYSGDQQSCNELGLSFYFEPDVDGEEAVAALWSDSAIENVNIAARERRGKGDKCNVLNSEDCSVPTNNFVADVSDSVFGLMAQTITKEFPI